MKAAVNQLSSQINMAGGNDTAHVVYYELQKVYLLSSLLASNGRTNLSSFLLDIDECKDELHNCPSDESCVNQIGSFICLPESTGCKGSDSSQLKSKAIEEYKVTTEIKMLIINYILD